MCLYSLEVNTDEQRESTLRFSGMHTASNLVGMTTFSVLHTYSCARTHTHTHKDTRTDRFCIVDSPPAEIFIIIHASNLTEIYLAACSNISPPDGLSYHTIPFSLK